MNAEEYKIILFICNWGPHTAFHTLQERKAPIPGEINVIRVPCAGRINRALILKAFEMGADGVAVVGCVPGACRYGSGPSLSSANIEDMQAILELLGLSKERLRYAHSLPDDPDTLLGFLQEFVSGLKSMGKSPVVPRIPGVKTAVNDTVKSIAARHDVYACQDCGKCSSACPLPLTGKSFSPRAIAVSAASGDTDAVTITKDLWSCLTCGVCYDRCPSSVNFPEFIRDLRGAFLTGTYGAHETHGGFFQSLMRTLSSPELEPRKWRKLPDDVKTDSESRTLFWGGCAPFFDHFFRNFLSVDTVKIVVNSLKLLNFFDIRPALLDGERCCGHDLLWSGDRENFLKLARLNVAAIEERGVEEVITSCPECFRTLSHDYPAMGIPVNFSVTHLYDILEREITKGAVGFTDPGRRLTYQDACRLSRFEKRPELPRALLNRLDGSCFSEMQDHGASAVCCGNSAWTGCDSYTKALQVQRLRQARETGSDLLITSCPKCQIHLKCAMEDPFFGKEITMEMMDLTEVLVRTIRWE